MRLFANLWELSYGITVHAGSLYEVPLAYHLPFCVEGVPVRVSEQRSVGYLLPAR